VSRYAWVTLCEEQTAEGDTLLTEALESSTGEHLAYRIVRLTDVPDAQGPGVHAVSRVEGLAAR
jgi:hypothetical protein